MELAARLAQLPDKPGVYLFRDQKGGVIYVGKATSLKNRVRSYFHSPVSQPPKVQMLVRHIADLEYIVTRSEVEALVLECNLIKSYRPRYNINLKDDKTYPYLKVAVSEDFPYLMVTRRRVPDGSRYFGPYTHVAALHDTLRWLRRFFPLRTCKPVIWQQACQEKRPCLDGHIGRCAAPCAGVISGEEYRSLVDEMIMFLEGKHTDLVQRLEAKMQRAAEKMAFEEAARWRDLLQAVQQVLARQQMATDSPTDQDYLGVAVGGGLACVQVFLVREGKVIRREHFFLESEGALEASETLSSFVQQYYGQAEAVPGEIVLSVPLEDPALVRAWLKEKGGHAVQLTIPHRGQKRKLLELVEENARLLLATRLEGHQRDQAALEELQQVLHLPDVPRRIECYDISNLQGTSAVGSMIVFAGGRPYPAAYRHFQIKTVAGPDDYASLREVLARRLARAGEGDEKFLPLPDMILIDGGKGQLNAGWQALREAGLEHIPVFGLAKKEEEIFIPGVAAPLVLPRDAVALQLLQQLRDEAHRFAVTYHRQRRQKAAQNSVLDQVPGVGPRRRIALLRAFGSLEGVGRASVEELAVVEGMNRRVAEQVYCFLHPDEAGNGPVPVERSTS